MTHQIYSFIDWLGRFDPIPLQNEAEVETKFVIQLFEHLGYPEGCRRDKYPVPVYLTGGEKKRGRKPEADFVYFSKSDLSKQDEDSSLVVIEVKAPEIDNFDEARQQAIRYAHSLKTPFLVLVNGYQIEFWKCHPYQADECVFERTVHEFKDEKSATKLYNLLNFDIVVALKNSLYNDTTHARYVQLTKALQQYPKLQRLLEKGDFKPSIVYKGNSLVVTRPKTRIICELPIFFKQGNCQIEFSNVLLRELTIHLTHRDIVNSLLLGLCTTADENMRNFLRKRGDNSFDALLGYARVTLNQDEVVDLCACVDVIGKEYKKILIETEDALKTWKYERVGIEDNYPKAWGFHLISVKAWVWDLVIKFANEFYHANGNSEWHIFRSIRMGKFVVTGQHRDAVRLWIAPEKRSKSVINDEVMVYYQPPYLYRHWDHETWQLHVGPRGIWTAEYTQKWLKNKLIPQVLLYYSEEIQNKNVQKNGKDFLEDLVDEPIFTEEIPLEEISRPHQLADYLACLNNWWTDYDVNKISSTLLRPYYTAFSNLARKADASSLNIDYITAKLGAAEHYLYKGTDHVKIKTYSDIIACLERHVTRIHAVDYEDSRIADVITRVFGAFIRDGAIDFRQEELNAAKDAVSFLWPHYQFEERYVVAKYPINISSWDCQEE